MLPVSLVSGKRASIDATCAEAVDVARAALEIVAPDGAVGAHLAVEPESDRVVVHYFASDLPGYHGWRWAVTVMRASRSKTVTIGESVLLPGPESLLPPAWVPWTERLRPGDLGVGDLLPTDEDDDRLEPGWNASDLASGMDDTDDVAEVATELDLLRPRVLSPIGLDDAVDRWVNGEHGPDAAMAQSAPATCSTCGFRLAVRGQLGQAFGVCANGISPSDGHMVTLDHGCGAHSEAVVVPTMAERTEPAIDEVGFEIVEMSNEPDGEPVDVVGEPVDELVEGATSEETEVMDEAADAAEAQVLVASGEPEVSGGDDVSSEPASG